MPRGLARYVLTYNRDEYVWTVCQQFIAIMNNNNNTVHQEDFTCRGQFVKRKQTLYRDETYAA